MSPSLVPFPIRISLRFIGECLMLFIILVKNAKIPQPDPKHTHTQKREEYKYLHRKKREMFWQVNVKFPQDMLLSGPKNSSFFFLFFKPLASKISFL